MIKRLSAMTRTQSWNTRPDANGTKYDLGADYKLTGEQLDDMGITAYGFSSKYAGETTIIDDKTVYTGVILTLHGIWEKSSSGSGSGDNNEGNDDSTNTYLLVGILIVIIILILVMIFLMRKK